MPVGLTSMLDAGVVLLAVALLLLVVGGIQPLAARVRLPPTVLLAGFGIAIGAASSLLPRGVLNGAEAVFTGLPISSETIIYVFLGVAVAYLLGRQIVTTPHSVSDDDPVHADAH